MKRYLIFFLFLSLLVSACSAGSEPAEMAPDADPENLPNLMGTYVINGIDPIGDEYGGHLTVSPGDLTGTYHFQWIIVGGIQAGTGIVEGNQVLVEWRTIEGVEIATGTAVFKVTETGQLYGIRTSDHLEGEGQEQAYPNQ